MAGQGSAGEHQGRGEYAAAPGSPLTCFVSSNEMGQRFRVECMLTSAPVGQEMFNMEREDHRQFHDLCRTLLLYEPAKRELPPPCALHTPVRDDARPAAAR